MLIKCHKVFPSAAYISCHSYHDAFLAAKQVKENAVHTALASLSPQISTFIHYKLLP